MVSMHSLDSLIFFKHVPFCPYLCASVYSSFTYFFNSPAFIFPPCVQIRLCNWKIPVGQLIVASFSSQSPSRSLSLSLSLEGLNATGASEAQERSLGKKEQRAVHLQLSPLCTSSPLSLFLPLFFPPLVTLSSLSPLASAPN